MTDAPGDFSLAADFPAASREDWLKIVSAALKGAPFDQKLVAETYDGLHIQPLYDRVASARAIVARAPAASWQIMARVDHRDPGAANLQSHRDLENGATGLTVVFDGAIGSYGYGLDASEAAVAGAFDGIHLDAGIAIECDLGFASDGERRVADHIERTGIAPSAVDIRFGLDPLGTAAVAGFLPAPWAETERTFAARVVDLAKRGFGGRVAAADARPVHAAGGSQAQELAVVLGNAVAYLRALESSGIDLDAARDMIYFRLAADADQFLTIAKFRALRRLWARIEDACGLAAKPTFVSAETAWRMMTRREPAVNMLRATMATFAAGTGGADAITVLPFTTALGLPDPFARRIARNTQLILLEESNLAKVSDPAAGSGAVEALTAELGGAAWTLFQEIEAQGGAAAALEAGLIQRRIAAVRAQHTAAIARRKDPLTGTTEFADLAEAAVSVLDVPRTSPNVDARGGSGFEPLPRQRSAEPFEELRDRSDARLAASGVRPRVFLANLGPLAAFTARASFARNFFEAGGIAALSSEGFPDHDAMVAAFAASGARLACLCSSDEVYATRAVDAARRLSAAGARHLYLAGRPGEQEAALRSAGIGTFIHVGCDVLATLQDAYARLASFPD